MKAAVFLHVPDSPYSAVALRYQRLARAFARRGDTLTIVAPQDFALLRRIDARFYVVLLPFMIAFRLWRRREFDAVLFHSYCGWVFSLWRGGVPMITSIHGLEPFHYAELRAAKRAAGGDLTLRFRVMYGWLMPHLLKLACVRSSAVVCQTREEERYLLDRGWTTARRLTRIVGGAPDAFFVDGRTYVPRARHLVMVAQWQERKGIRTIVEAFTSLVQGGADLVLTCLGTRRTDVEVLERFPADVRGRVRNVSTLPHDAMPSFYRDADIFVHASVMEGSSQAQMEAMAAALPIIATATAPAVDLLVDGDGFVLVPKGSAPAIVAAVTRLIDDAALRARLGSRAQLAARYLTADSVDSIFLGLFDAAVSAASGAVRPLQATAFLHVSDSPFSAVPLIHHRLAEAFAARGDTLRVVTPEQFAVLRPLPSRLYVLLLPFVIAARLIVRRDDDVVLFHSYCGWVFSLIKGRRPIITAFYGLEPFYYTELEAVERAAGRTLSWRFRAAYAWLMPWILKVACRRSDRVICQTREERQFLIDRRWTTPDRVALIGAGVPARCFVENRSYAPRATRLLMVAQWQERKGIRYVAEALTTLVREGADVQLVCAGTRQPDAVVLGAFPEDIRTRVTNVADVPHDQMPEFYRAADVFVHASVMEGSSQAQMEAMAAALPIVATATAPAIDLLVDGDGFLLVPKRDGMALAAAIRRLLPDRALRRHLGQRALLAARDGAADVTDAAQLALFDALAPAASRRAA